MVPEGNTLLPQYYRELFVVSHIACEKRMRLSSLIKAQMSERRARMRLLRRPPQIEPNPENKPEGGGEIHPTKSYGSASRCAERAGTIRPSGGATGFI